MFVSVELLPYAFTELVAYAFFGLGGYLAWRLVRAYERRTRGNEELAVTGGRVRSLEQAMGEIDRRIAEMEDAQRFVTSLLVERAGTAHPSEQGIDACKPLRLASAAPPQTVRDVHA